ncbi:hypothetical protein ONZ45_g6475 [Pleurotus djamor]|nr:hypothetical protein ONZ45_g6475 [Pleurotus djamor]
MPSNKYADVSVFDRVAIFLKVVFSLPLKLATTLALSPFIWHTKHKTWRRVLSDKAFRWATLLPVPQLQYLLGTTVGTYEKTMPKMGLPSEIEELGQNAKLLWIGPKRRDRVLLYLHGGAFLAPVEDITIFFWRYVQQQLKKNNEAPFDLGIAILNYTLVPEGTFPTPLHQAALAINHLTSTGLNPSGLQLAGDSAGANLICQVLSHALHPIPSLPSLQFLSTSPIRGAYLISPWVTLTADTGSHYKFSSSDILAQPTLRHWGALVKRDIPSSLRPISEAYIEAVKAPEGWWDGLMDKVVERVLVTAGGQECLKEDIVDFVKVLESGKVKGKRGDFKFVLQNGGVHNDMFMDFLAGASEEHPERVGDLTKMIIEWLAEGYNTL